MRLVGQHKAQAEASLGAKSTDFVCGRVCGNCILHVFLKVVVLRAVRICQEAATLRYAVPLSGRAFVARSSKPVVCDVD